MKKQIQIQALLALSLAIPSVSAQAALRKVSNQPRYEQAIEDDSITPEADDEEVVVVRKKPKTVVKRVVREQTETSSEGNDNYNNNSNSAQAIAIAAPAAKPSMGSQLDAGVRAK